MVYVDGVEFWIYLASRHVHRQGEFCLRSIEHNHECDIIRRVLQLCANCCCVFLHLKYLTSEADAMLLIQFGRLRVIILVTHLFDGLYAPVIPANILLSSLRFLDQVKHSAIIAVQRMFKQSTLLAIMDQLVIWFIKFLPQLKKETSFFSCWLLCNARYASPDSVPKQRYIWSRRTTHSVCRVVSRELLLLLCASVLPLVSSTAYILPHAGIFNMKLLLHIELLKLEERFAWSHFLSNHEVFDISNKPVTFLFTLLRFVWVLLYVQQTLKQFQFYLQSFQLQEEQSFQLQEEYACQWSLDFSVSR